MTVAKHQFEKNLESINMLGGLYDYFSDQLKAVDLSELLRAQYVMLVSALDHYVHTRVREGLLDIFYDSTKSSPNIDIPLRIVKLLLQEQNEQEQRRILDAEVRDILSKNSYQSSRNIENAFGLIEIKKIWSSIAQGFGKPAEDIVNILNLVVTRRNKIAHESDINSTTGDKEYIDKNIVSDTVIFIKTLISEFDKL
jgi:hypothetical protein